MKGGRRRLTSRQHFPPCLGSRYAAKEIPRAGRPNVPTVPVAWMGVHAQRGHSVRPQERRDSGAGFLRFLITDPVRCLRNALAAPPEGLAKVQSGAPGSPELPPWLARRGGRERLELLQLARAQAPSPLDFEGVGHAEGASIAAQRLRAPADSELLEALVIEAGHLGRCRRGSHVRER
jgi:hypothetical protein